MVQSLSTYLGEKTCQIEHLSSKKIISTDAPKDNQGKGESFSPSDLVGAGLGSCILTTLGIVCDREGINLKGAQVEVTKEMSSNPRRISRLSSILRFPKGIPQEARPKLEKMAYACPVHASLHPDIQAPIEFIYPD